MSLLKIEKRLNVNGTNMTKQILIKSKTPKVYKNKKLNNANFTNFNLTTYQVFLHLVSKIGKVNEFGTYKQTPNIDISYTLTAKEFSEIFNIELANSYRFLKKACKIIAREAITIEKPDSFETWEIPICSMARYNHKEGSMTIEFNQKIMPYLMQVKEKFVLYNLKEISNFGSFYTTRLYELIQEFKDTGWVNKSISQLRTIFAAENIFKKYNDFKKKTFGHAVDEINSQFDIDLTFREVKEGRKIVSIHFFFKKTIIRKTFNPHTGKDSNIYIKPKRK